MEGSRNATWAMKIVFFLLVLFNLTDNVIGAWVHEQLHNAQLGAQILYVKYIILLIVFLLFCIELSYGMRLRRYEWFGIAYLLSAMAMTAGISILHPEYSEASRLYLYIFPIITYFSGVWFGAKSEFGIDYIVKCYAWMSLAITSIFIILNI